MRNLTFKAAMLKGSQPTVNRQSTDGQSQRHCKQTPLSKRWKVLMTLVFLFTLGIGQMWGADHCTKTISTDGKTCTWNFYDDYSSYTAEAIVTKNDAGFENGLYIIAGSKSNCSLSSSQYLSVAGTNNDAYIYVPVPSNAVGTITFTYGGSASTRYTTLLDSEGAATTESVAPNGSGKSNSISLINANVTTETISGADGNKWAKLKVTGGEVKYRIISVTLTTGSYSSASAPTISAPTTDQSASYTIGDEIAALTVTASGTPTPTYQWYYNSSASTTGATSLGSSAQLASYTPSNAAASDLYYYCVVTNSAGSATSHYFHVTVSAPSTPTHAITYNETSLKGQSVSGYPTTYYEGTGIASFDPLDDVTDWHFDGWDPASISDTEDQDVEVFATWVAAYNVTFSAGAGSGTVPSSFQKWEGATFNLPDQGSMVAPSGKAFDGWKANGTGDKLAANAEYTMTAADVNFVAQWKATPTTIFHWRSKSDSRTIDAANGTTTGGTTTLRTTDSGKSWSEEGATYASGVADDMKGTVSGKELKSGGNALYLELELTTGTFQEGDTVFVTGYLPWIVSTSTTFAPFDATDSIFTGSGKGSVNTGYSIIKEGVDASKLYVRRGRGAGSGIAAIKVIRPAQRDIVSTEITLSDLKVNNHSISSDSLDILKTPEAYALTLGDEFVDAPVIKFNEHTVITYVEGLPATKVTDKVYTVTATVNGDGKWQAAQEIAGTTYTVTAPKASSAKVSYYDGATKLGEETVGIGGNPAEYASHQGKDYATFVAWYNNSDLTEEHKIADISAFEVTEAINVYGKWNPAYATSINIEKWVLDNGVTNAPFRAKLTELNYKYATLNNLDSLNDDPSKDYRNYAYLGQKVNKTNSEISFLLKNGSNLKVRFGHLGSTINVVYGTDDPIALTSAEYANESPAGDKVYEYTATADVIVKFQCTGTSTSVFKQIMIDEEIQNVILPAIVTLDANGGTYTDESVKYTGTPLVIGDATPADAEHIFEGWHVGTVEGAKIDASAYVPTANVTLVAKYVVKPSPFSLTALTYTIGAGEAQNVGYVEGTYTYTVELPYAGSYENITVAATLKEGSSSIVEGAVMTVTSLPGAATFTVSDGAEGTQLYTINFKKAAKDGVCIIKGNVGNNTFVIDEDASLFAGTADKNNVRENSSTYDEKTGWKFQSRPARLGLTLSGDEAFQEGDVVEVFVTSVADIQGNNDKMRIFDATDATAAHVLYESEADMIQGANRFVLPATTTKSLYLHRTKDADYDNFNPYVAYVAVYRPMDPILTAITINGEAAVKGEGNTFTITLPAEGTNLGSLTVVPTVIRNEAHATTPEAVISNEGAWKAGDNTYRVMDKDGDYTDYTITITLQGEAPAPDITTQPAGVAYCAGSEPTLEVVATGDELHYAWFKEAGETDEAVGTDLASYTVEAAGTYYVIVTNHVDGRLDASVTSENAVVTLNVAAAITKQPVNKRDIVSGASVTLSVEATNATGYQWYICDDAEKANASAISGADAANYVFNCMANAYYYCVVGNACGADIESNVVSVKLEPVGCNVLDGTIPSAAPYIYDNGEWTLYAVTSGGKLDGTSRFDDDAKDFDGNTVNAITYGRVGMTFAKDVESLTIYATSSSSDRAISSIKVTTDDVTTGTPSYSDVTFTASAEKLGKKDSSSPYRFVLEANNMLLEAGKKYWLQFSGTVSAFKICYSEALAMPVLPTLSNQELCAGAAYQEFDATITNETACEGTVSYKWFSTADTENPVAETAEFTPSTEGTYYVVVTHAKAGHITRTAQSANLSVAHFDALTLVSHSEDVFQHMGTAATLSVVATGKNVAYVWYTCSNAAGDDAVAITPAETENELTIASIAEGVQYYKVVISHDCDATTLSHVFKVEGWDQLEQVDVTATTTWDMTNVSANAINLKNDDPALNKQNVRLLLANIDGVNNNASFNAQALMFEGQHIGRTSNSVKHLAGQYVQFNVTVPGMVSVTFASNGDAQRSIQINGKECSRTTDDGTYIKYDVAVEPGSVEIEDVQGYVRISRIEFKAEASHTRTGLNPSYLGTLCWTNNAVLGGATLYKFVGKNENNYLEFEDVPENRIEAGKPYIFMPENGNTQIKVYNTDDEPALTEADLEPVNNMYGTVEGKTLVPGVDDNMYYFSSNHIWAVKDFTVNIPILPNRCYIDYPAVLAADPAPAAAPGRRRVTMGVNGQNVATGMGEIEASETPVKVLINGQIFIIRGEKMFDVTGKLVK